jgi:hypothetical protein
MKSFEMLLLKNAQRCRDPTTVILKWSSCDSLLKDAEDGIPYVPFAMNETSALQASLKSNMSCMSSCDLWTFCYRITTETPNPTLQIQSHRLRGLHDEIGVLCVNEEDDFHEDDANRGSAFGGFHFLSLLDHMLPLHAVEIVTCFYCSQIKTYLNLIICQSLPIIHDSWLFYQTKIRKRRGLLHDPKIPPKLQKNFFLRKMS